jgi:adenosylcobinamide-phosphate synthase
MTVYLSLLADFLIGDPKGFPHPVIWVGKVIAFYEKLFYGESHQSLRGGLFTITVLLTVTAFLGGILYLASLWQPLYIFVSIYFMYTSLAWRSLKKETGYVIDALEKDDILAARKFVSYVVGRDTTELTKEEIIKADIETVAENTVDGVLAPLFYMMIGYFLGFPVIFVWLYKTINTLDSMVGYRDERYLNFGRFAAKVDDVVNFIPARLGSLTMLAAGILPGLDLRNGWKIFRRDRFAHLSPNSAQSESAVAGLLGLQLGGSHHYHGILIEKPTIGDALKEPDSGDYQKSLRILDFSVVLFVLIFTLFYLWKLIVSGGIL